MFWHCIQWFLSVFLAVPSPSLCCIPSLIRWSLESNHSSPFFIFYTYYFLDTHHSQDFPDFPLLLTSKFSSPALISSIVQFYQEKLQFTISQTRKCEFTFYSFLSSLTCLFSLTVSNLEAHPSEIDWPTQGYFCEQESWDHDGWKGGMWTCEGNHNQALECLSAEILS